MQPFKTKKMRKKINIIFFLVIMTFSAKAQDYWQIVGNFAYPVRSFAFDSSQSIYAGTLGAGVFYSSNNGSAWNQRTAGLTDLSIVSLCVNNSGEVFAGSESHGIFKSTNNGLNWIQTSFNSGTVYSIGVSPNGNMFAGSDGVFRSVDAGVNWTIVLDSVISRSLLVNSQGYVFVLSQQGHSFYRTFNDGNSWEWRDVSFNFNSLCLAPNGVVFATTAGEFNHPDGFYLHSSGDFGSGWNYLYNFQGPSNRVTVDSEGKVFVARSFGIWLSLTSGISGYYINSGLNLNGGFILGLGSGPSGYVFAGQENGNVYRSINGPTGISSISSIISDYVLYQNYPNPFNPETKIKFSVPISTYAKLYIYDALGKEVAILFDGYIHAGVSEVAFNATDYPSGIYFYKLITEKQTLTRKMIIVK